MNVILIANSGLLKEEVMASLSGLIGIDVTTISGDSSDVLAAVIENDPDIIILDVGLSKKNGFKIIRKIKDKGIEAKVIVLTSYTYPLYSRIVLDSGADYYFSKFSDLDKIVSTINTMNIESPQVSSIN